MKIFLDANILVSVLNKEYPNFTYTARILSLADEPSFGLYTSPLCLAIAYYFAQKKSGKKTAGQKIDLLLEKLKITMIDEHTVNAVRTNKKINDFEDGLQYYSAVNSQCACIVTDDKNDFYFSEIEVLSSRVFMEKLASNKLTFNTL
ncbi:MAG TPA: PIN domain-containing protein [Flavobacteriales bacterium]|nr:PIN domain-containing protein [Flavobacteriales bacterium]